MSEKAIISLALLDAGDLIDRTVRFYRSNFWTFIWIASPTEIIGTIISVGTNSRSPDGLIGKQK